MTQPLIDVKNLTLKFKTDEGLVTAVDDISFSIEPGEIMGLVGESGSGKSVTAKSLMHLNASNSVYNPESRITMCFDDQTIEVMSLETSKEMKIIRGGAISMIFQEPMASFAPAITIGSQMVEQLQIHTSALDTARSLGKQMIEQAKLHADISAKEAEITSIEMLERVGISDASKRFNQYAFELSGGMRQRAMIAMALSTRPKLLIADEPTTALDVTIQAQIIDLMKGLVKDFGMSIIFITHDLGVIAQTVDTVAVMYLGRIIEKGSVNDVITQPQHPYTQGLINALPKLHDLDSALTPIPGDIPSPLERPSGCVFHTRCPQSLGQRCETEIPSFYPTTKGHETACFLQDKGKKSV